MLQRIPEPHRRLSIATSFLKHSWLTDAQHESIVDYTYPNRRSRSGAPVINEDQDMPQANDFVASFRTPGSAATTQGNPSSVESNNNQ